MNKRNNKGFSLIELIVVVAIMAVLVGVLAPTYLTCVEKTRVQKDNSAVAEVVQAIKVAAADEKINTELADASKAASYTIGTSAAALTQQNSTTPLLDAELAKVIDKVGLTSNTVTGVTVGADITNGKLAITVTATTTEPTANNAATPIKASFAALGTN